MSAEPQITQAEMDKYFETGGKEVPTAVQEAEKAEVAVEKQELADVSQKQPEKTETKTEVKQEVKPEIKTEAQKEVEVQVNVEGKMVPLAELMAERKNRQAWEQTAAQQQQQLTETLKMLQERAKSLAPEEQAKAPDPMQDPQGFAVWEYEQHKKQVAELNEWRKQQDQLNQRSAQLQQAASWAQSQEMEFSKTQPKYSEAYKFATESRTKEYTALGYTPDQIQQLLASDNQNIVALALQQRKNPAQLIWDYANAKGFVVAEQKKVPDLDDKVKTIAKGQEAAKGLTGTAGGAPTEINNLADLAAASEDMDDEEFSKAFDKLKPKMKGKYV